MRRRAKGDSLDTAIHIAQIVSAVVVIIMVLTQSRGAGLGNIFGGDNSSIYHTRRGIERTLFNFTIGSIVVFLIISIISTLAF